ncbi:MAG: GNAT family N-acetyltransferase, partial [Paracoccus sp. (in: a-proteobacteria)]
MSCACGHHAPATPDSSGAALRLDPAPVALHGRLICADAGQMMTALSHLPDHVDLSRAEPGCLR